MRKERCDTQLLYCNEILEHVYPTISYTEQFSGVAEINLCVGKEWHRFPSSFFLPDKRCS